MEKSGMDKKFKNLSQERDLDCTNAEELWLVKVPKYISSRWEKVASGGEGGQLLISEAPDGKPDIKFTLTEDPTTKSAIGNVPTEHKFVISSVQNQSLAVFTETTSESAGSGSSNTPSKLVLEGHVKERCEMRPLANKKYMMLKRQSIIQAQEPEHKVMHLARAVHSFKPVNTHKHIIEAQQKKKQEGKKARDDKEKVQEMLFGAFENHQYYNIKDLEKITKQPMVYLKEILKEICNYNAKNPHKNMWELKPEYRCYKTQEKESEGN